jgi:SAM-dependent methyltransferase
MTQSYDRIGMGYTKARQPDPRLGRIILDALGTADSVINVGAGTGSYEPTDRLVIAVEPSITMIGQRPGNAAPAVRAIAEQLPFGDSTFMAGMAILTIHHWRDPEMGIGELCRVARDRVVLLTWDPDSEGFWLVQDYFPEFRKADSDSFPGIQKLQESFADAEVFSVLIPHDCSDGFLGAYWRRPEAYLDRAVRRGISSFSRGADLGALDLLEADLNSGAWKRRHGALLEKEDLDVGYRLIVARPNRT